MPVVVVKNDLGLIAKGVLALTKSQLLIGIPADAPSRQPEDGEEAPPSNAVIGYLQETGAPDQNLPARPFLVPAVQGIAPEIGARLRKAGKEALFGGGAAAVDKAYHAIGLVAQNAVRARITDGDFAPLAKRTLEARKARGRTGERPLLDTGQLRNSVTYVIKKKGE